MTSIKNSEADASLFFYESVCKLSIRKTKKPEHLLRLFHSIKLDFYFARTFFSRAKRGRESVMG